MYGGEPPAKISNEKDPYAGEAADGLLVSKSDEAVSQSSDALENSFHRLLLLRTQASKHPKHPSNVGETPEFGWLEGVG